MARYIYKCESCEIEIETDHGMTESPAIQCPNCDTEVPMFKVITGGTGAIFKGKTGVRTTGNREDSWDWGKPRPKASDGHKMTKEERMHIETKHIKKYMDRAKGMVATPQTLATAVDKKAKKIVT